jgi:hypothetical protein
MKVLACVPGDGVVGGLLLGVLTRHVEGVIVIDERLLNLVLKVCSGTVVLKLRVDFRTSV